MLRQPYESAFVPYVMKHVDSAFLSLFPCIPQKSLWARSDLLPRFLTALRWPGIQCSTAVLRWTRFYRPSADRRALCAVRNHCNSLGYTIPGGERMFTRNRQTARWLLLCGCAFLLVGCATGQSGHVSRNPTDCPMSFMLYCDVSGHGTNRTASHCRCVRQ